MWHGRQLAEVPSPMALRKWLVLSEGLGGRVRWRQLRGAVGLGAELRGGVGLGVELRGAVGLGVELRGAVGLGAELHGWR